MLLGREALIAEEDDAVAQKSAADIRELRRLQGPRQIDAADLGAEGGRQLADLDCVENLIHRRLLQKTITLRKAAPRLASAMASLMPSKE